ncbi:hypothetical protein [Shewanella dokdonensis]|uniref:Uncharacterized protein n=1 Tax=Shewanella dokdonensis TaxID=712036 RepID=A0ABX8DBF4_9GAMM|nr:hypothetical protein [Shewanella dokdonensis]MCL1075476.1 hypothetical protein [Shewanella dokdonensis]QVK22154.1 hypothetical protein KHX94_11980 [Shewanella dokdonensis]
MKSWGVTPQALSQPPCQMGMMRHRLLGEAISGAALASTLALAPNMFPTSDDQY